MYQHELRQVVILCVVAMAWSCVAAHGDEPAVSPEQFQFFENEIRPLFVEHCHECHSATAKKLQAGLRLDGRKFVLRGGDTGPAAIPGNPDESLLIQAVKYEGFEMPPRGRLPREKIAALEKWIQSGMPWPTESAAILPETGAVARVSQPTEAHWAWRAVRNQTPPAVRDERWPRNAIDRFVLRKLEDVGLRPAAPADKRALLRRVYFDLIGLPPSRDQIHRFLDDDSPHAYEHVVDELLESQHFGEKWARHWLDLVRYAETCGHEFDYPLPYAFRYRDYVIRAFNADVPYDQFVREHLAGDLLEVPRRHPEDGFNESIIGTGFWFLGEAVHAPTDVRGDESDRINNQIDVMTKTFLGLTVGCARCHDHKFDPISTQDYYALAGFLQSSRRQDAMLDPHDRIASAAGTLEQLRQQGNTELRSWWNVAMFDSLSAYLLATLATVDRAGVGGSPSAHSGESQHVAGKLDAARLQRWREALSSAETSDPSHPMYAWRKLVLDEDDRDFSTKRLEAAEQISRLRDEYESAWSATEPFASFDSESFGDWRAAGEAFGRGPSRLGDWQRMPADAMLVDAGVAHSGLLSHRFRGVLRSPTFELRHRQIHYRMNADKATLRLIVDGYTMDEFNALLFADVTLKDVSTAGTTRWVTQHRDLEHYLGHRAHIEIIDHGDGFTAVDEIRFSNDPAPPPPPSPIATELLHDRQVDSPADLANAYERWAKQSAADMSSLNHDAVELVNWLGKHDLLDVRPPGLSDLAHRMSNVEQMIEPPVFVHALTDGTGEDERVHIRGNHTNLGPVVPRRMLVSVSGADQPVIEHGSGRLELARRIVDPANPFTARIITNRLWHHVFGVGLVPTVDDFGAMGQPPSHPELLDWLATEFVRDGWSIKRLLRMLVLSETYRMSSHASLDTAKIAAVDPTNRLLHRARIRRLTAEAIRDNILAVSGSLDRRMFGPSVPVYINEFMEGRGRPTSGPLDGAGRRSIYIHVRRNFLSPMMLTFDMPSPFNTVGRRGVSNVPAQSLILMNDSFVVEQSRRWAERLLNYGGVSFDERIVEAWESGVGQIPAADQLDRLRRYLREQAEHASASADDPSIWADLCHAIMNMKGFTYIH